MGLDKITQEHKCSAPVGSEECASCRHRGVCNRIAQAVEGYFAAVFANGRSCTEYETSERGVPSGADVGLFGGRSSQDVRTAITANANGTSCNGLGRVNGLSSVQMIVDDFGGTDGLSPVLVMIDDSSVHGSFDRLNARREITRMADTIPSVEREQIFFGGNVCGVQPRTTGNTENGIDGAANADSCANGSHPHLARAGKSEKDTGAPTFEAIEKSSPTKYKVGQVYRVTERPEPYYIRIEGLETPSPDRAQVICRVLDRDIVTRFDIGSRFEEYLMQVSEPVDITGEEVRA